MMDELIIWLCNYAYDHHVGYILADDLNPETPSESDGDHQLVVINMKWHNHNEVPFSYAHEIGHILNGDKGKHEYSANSLDIKEEYQANLRGIDIMLEYAKRYEIPTNNPIRFCERFGIHTELEYIVANKLK